MISITHKTDTGEIRTDKFQDAVLMQEFNNILLLLDKRQNVISAFPLHLVLTYSCTFFE